MEERLSDQEYSALSDQKAEDWRAISEVNPTLFGVAGAIFAAGIAQSEAAVVALAPLPLYLGVWHMVRHARLQLQQITYLAVFGPEGRSWERDIAVVRPRFWRRLNGGPDWFDEFKRPSAWNTWLVISLVITALACAIPPLACYENAWAAPVLGTVNLIAGVLVFVQSRKIQPEREEWTTLWEEYKSEQARPSR